MKNIILRKTISYLLLFILMLYFVTGFAMTRQYGCDHLMPGRLAHTIHLNLTIPFVILIIAHVFIYVKADVKKLFCKIFKPTNTDKEK